MPTIPSLAVLFFFLMPTVLSPAAPQRPSKQLWSWFGNCRDGKSMRIEVVERGKALYRSSFQLCPISDRSKEVHRRLDFFFKGGHVFDGESRTSRNDTIEGNIWQAGADPGVIYFGVSFSDKKQLLLNTIHIARPDRASVTQIDPGLLVRTIPVGRPRSTNRNYFQR